MTRKSPASPPKGQQWAWQIRDVLLSDAWRGMSINARRLIDFLQLEHLAHGGTANGLLKAPQRQLQDFGIGAHQCTPAIRELEQRGLIHCQRAGMRIATTYALAWIPLHDGREPNPLWRTFKDPSLKPLPPRKSRNLPVKQQALSRYLSRGRGENSDYPRTEEPAADGDDPRGEDEEQADVA